MRAKIALTFLLTLLCGIGNAQTAPRVFSIDGKALAERKQKKDASLTAAIAKLDANARKVLKSEVASIITKQATPPSGSKNDYMSQAPYFWRNPETKDGLPYIRKDGERNPEIQRYPDHKLMDDMMDAVEDLSRAYYFTDKEEYAAKATDVLRMWFLNAKTRMNPNLEFAQAIPGLNTGRGIGIIETRGLTRVVESVGLLAGAKAWTKDDQAGLEKWFGDYLRWLTDSKNGRDEGNAKNNHGTFYDVQAISFALFARKDDVAKKLLESAKQNRIAKQIEPNGSQPLELERTQSWGYSTMNLEGFVSLAELGDAAGVDLWNYETKGGRSIRKAFDFLYPFATGEKKWTHKQIDPLKPERLYTLMRRANGKFRDKRFNEMMSAVPKLKTDDPEMLFHF